MTVPFRTRTATPSSKAKRFFLGCGVLLAIGIMLILAGGVIFLTAPGFIRMQVTNPSMEPTLSQADFLVVNRLLSAESEIARGDIVILAFPMDPQAQYVKRLIGLPGDKIRIQAGQVYLNDQPLNEPYIAEAPTYHGTWTVPAGQVFVLGDNRNKSADSHSWGFVPYENISGKVLAVYWPMDHFRILNP